MGAFAKVEIDLPELIRLKPNDEVFEYSPHFYVGIDLPELIRLKHITPVTTLILLLPGRD